MKSFIFTIQLRDSATRLNKPGTTLLKISCLIGPAPEEYYMEDDDMIETGEEVYCG